MPETGSTRPRGLPFSLKLVWGLAFAAMLVGVVLAFRYGPQIVPFLDVSR
jgi:hypothetical protein